MRYIFILALAFHISSALAQEAITPAPAVPVEPAPVIAPAETPAVPAAAAEAMPATMPPTNIPTTLQPTAGDFPPLPPSRPCARPDADGMWKLTAVYENPRSSMSTDFASYPHQYILFLRDDTYRTYKDVWGDKSDAQVRVDLEKEQPTVLQQFLVHQSGILFFYKDGAFLDSQACFIVANSKGPYNQGQIILMPPEGQSSVRLAMVYTRILKAEEVRPNETIQNNQPRRRVRRR